MGPLYGSSRDLSAPICRPLPGLFDQPAWEQLHQAFRSLVERVSDDAGTMRYADFAGWRRLSLQAAVSPLLLLKQPKGAEPPGDPTAAIAAWHDASLWPDADRKAALAALQPAREVTARWMIEHTSMPAAQAEHVAAALVAKWVEARIAFGKGPEGWRRLLEARRSASAQRLNAGRPALEPAMAVAVAPATVQRRTGRHAAASFVLALDPGRCAGDRCRVVAVLRQPERAAAQCRACTDHGGAGICF
ncbi:hypothetical protein ACFQGW_00870 [Xanthomonas theicola]